MIAGGLKFDQNLSVRVATASDSNFLHSLYHTTRDDLRLIEAEEEFIEALIDQQHFAQREGYGSMFPNALYFVIEMLDTPIGRLVVDFGHNEVRVIDIAFIPAARSKGYGKVLFHGLQRTAAMVRAPLALTVHRSNPRARQFYVSIGFKPEEATAAAERMVWYPGTPGA